jgi:hypothetical protein
MKDLKNYINVNESKTKLTDIQNYGRTWVSEWGADFCGNILSEFIKGVKNGMQQYKADDPKFQDRCIKCLDEILEVVKEKIY